MASEHKNIELISPRRMIRVQEVKMWATGPTRGSVYHYTDAMVDGGHNFEDFYVADTPTLREVLSLWDDPDDAVANSERPGMALWVLLPYSSDNFGEEDGPRWYRVEVFSIEVLGGRLRRRLNKEAPDGKWVYDTLQDVGADDHYCPELMNICERYGRPIPILLRDDERIGAAEWDSEKSTWRDWVMSVEAYIASEIKAQRDSTIDYAADLLDYLLSEYGEQVVDRVFDKLREYHATPEEKEKTIQAHLEDYPEPGPISEIEVHIVAGGKALFRQSDWDYFGCLSIEV